MTDPASASTATAAADWPLAVVAHWTDYGYARSETRTLLALMAGTCLWPAAVILLLDGSVSVQLLGLGAVLVAWLAWRVFRGKRTEIELTLQPDRMRIGGSANTPGLELSRRDAGWLLASESGIDWNERLLLLSDRTGREVARLRAVPAAVEVPDPGSVSETWWASTMPPGTRPDVPPRSLSVTALLGAWWPSDQRASLRGTMAIRRSWQEGDLAGYDAWDRRERRRASLVAAAALVFIYALAIPTLWPMTLTDAAAFIPPGVLGLAFAIRGFVR